VYFLNLIVEYAPTGVVKVPIQGGAATLLAPISPSPSPNGLAVDARNAYWTQNGALMSIPLAGGTARTLVPPLVGDGSILFNFSTVLVHDGILYWMGWGKPNGTY
jgi:hypothetical protein